jgi:hypothetical protein
VPRIRAQRLLPGRADADEQHTHQKLILDSPIKSWEEHQPPPKRLAVLTSPSEVQEEFRWILDALVTVLRAAVETGNPVRWC